MAIETSEYLDAKDLYIDYPFEEVMFRVVKESGAIYRKFYGEEESLEVISHNNKLFNDALLSGDKITQAEYESILIKQYQ